MQVSKIDKTQAVKIGKAALYVGASAVISYLITLIANQPDLLGPLTPIVNVVLVTLKQVFTKPAEA
jgi:hypothetical protein